MPSLGSTTCACSLTSVSKTMQIMPWYPFASFSIFTFIDLCVRCVDLPLHVDVSWLRNVVPSFSLCSDHHTAHTHASRTVALCFSHANLCWIVLNSRCALGNAFSFTLWHMLVAARVAPDSCDQHSKPMYEVSANLSRAIAKLANCSSVGGSHPLLGFHVLLITMFLY